MDEYVRSDVFDERLRRVDDENDRQNHRLDLLEKNGETLHKLVTSVEKLALSMDTMRQEMEKQGKRLEAIEAEPADKWKKFTWLIFTAIAGAVVGFFVSKLI